MNKLVRKELTNIIEQSAGKLLLIGLNDKSLLKLISESNQIVTCDILNNNHYNNSKMENRGSKSKNISIKSIRKIYGRKKINTIICDYKHIDEYLKFFVKDSIYITNGSVIIYGKMTSLMRDFLVSKYKRYHIKAEVIGDDNSYMVKLAVGKVKTNIIKDRYYYISDRLKELGELISDLLVG